VRREIWIISQGDSVEIHGFVLCLDWSMLDEKTRMKSGPTHRQWKSTLWATAAAEDGRWSRQPIWNPSDQELSLLS
jgi:hypothetical protein